MAFLIYLLLCLSLHACSARHLGIIDSGTGAARNLAKDVGKAKTYKTLIGLKLRTFVPEEILPQEKQVTEDGERKTLESLDSANNMKHKDITAIGEVVNNKVLLTPLASWLPGTEMTPSFLEDMQEATRTEVWKRQARSILGSVQDDTEETVNSKESNIVEDVVVMDYAQPHRKPPIHNRKP